MALPNSGPLSISQINGEFPKPPAPYSLSKYYGVAAGIPTGGPISISQFYGKANVFVLNINASVASPDIRQLALNAGWNGTSPVLVNFNCPLVNTLRFTTAMSFPNGLTLNISQDCLVGGVLQSSGNSSAIYTRIPLTINNLGTINGSGGFGGNGGSSSWTYLTSSGFANGGSGGQGQGFQNTNSLIVSPNLGGSNGEYSEYRGGTLGGDTAPWALGGAGGTGGTWGIAGGAGSSSSSGGTGGGPTESGSSGKPPGYYVDGNSFITWQTTGTRKGRVI